MICPSCMGHDENCPDCLGAGEICDECQQPIGLCDCEDFRMVADERSWRSDNHSRYSWSSMPSLDSVRPPEEIQADKYLKRANTETPADPHGILGGPSVTTSGTKAYLAFDTKYPRKVVVFGDTRGKAKRAGADMLGADFGEVRVKRAKRFDIYAERGSIPLLAMLRDEETARMFTCAECADKITPETKDARESDDGDYFCSEACEKAFEAENNGGPSGTR